MSWTEKFSLIIVTAIFSLVGGAAAEHFWPNAVPDLGAASIAKNISAHQFTLIDSAGATRGMIDVPPPTSICAPRTSVGWVPSPRSTTCTRAR